MATTKAGQKAVNKYVKENYDRFNTTMPKGKKDVVAEFAKSKGMSLNAFINEAIDEKMDRMSEE